MEKRLMKAMVVLGAALLLLCSCTVEENYVDSHKVGISGLEIMTEGQRYTVSLEYFQFNDDGYVGNDTIYLENEVKTANTGFAPVECLDILSVKQYGNYQVRRCLYRTSFEVMITSWACMPRSTWLPFTFEAEEIWLNGEKVAEQPFVFEKTNTNLTELDHEENMSGKYLLDFEITVHNRYLKKPQEKINRAIEIVRLNESIPGLYVDPSDIDVTVTYDWKPE